MVTSNGVDPYTAEEMAEMPEQFCMDCGAPVDSFCREGNEILWHEEWGGPERLCYDCQKEHYNTAVFMEGGVCEQQRIEALGL